MQTAESEDELLEKAKDEEKAYNWVEAAKLYEQVAESFLGKKSTEEVAETYRMLGYAYSRAARTARRAKQFRERHEHAINAYRKAVDLFKQVKNKPKELECEGLAFYVTSISSASLIEAKDAISKSFELLIESSEIYNEKDDKESIARTLTQAGINSFVLLNLCSEQEEALKVSQRGIDISIKARKISKEIKHFQYYAEALFAEVCLVEQTVQKKNREHAKRLFFKCEKYLRFIEDSNDFYVLGWVYYAVGMCYGRFGVIFAKSEKEKSEYYDKAISFLEKSEEFARKSKDNFLITSSVYYLNGVIWSTGRKDYLAKRSFQDFQFFIKFSRIYANSINPLNLLTNHFLINIYLSFVYDRNKMRDAEKGIKYAMKTLGMTSFTPMCVAVYFILTVFYQKLTFLATTKDKQDEFAKKTLQCAEQAEQIGKYYDDGYPLDDPPQYYYNCAIITARGTQAYITENKNEKIKFLKEAAVALEKHPPNKYDIPNLSYSRSNKFHLGTFYFNISILTNETSLLRKAKELFLEVIKETIKFKSTGLRIRAYEWIAIIEDRNGNYIASAENYEKAQNLWPEFSKIFGVKAYEVQISLERAKAYHKIENHLKAKECYISASNIVEELSTDVTFPYWALYWKALALLEEAEFLSKQERLEEAIKAYERGIISFQNTISTDKQAPRQIKKRMPLDFIDTLEKLATTRIDYCSARIGLEKARILGKKGKHLKAAEIFGNTASQFRELCDDYKIEREHRELEAIYHLCRAWEQMELAEEYFESERFTKAADQFNKASNFSNETKYKLLASGNSAYCLALELGCEFDKSYDTEAKAQLYPKIKSMLRNAASSYDKGAFKGAADWALATSTYFDAAWHLIKADEELDIIKKKEIIGIASRYLRSASELFGKSGYINKEKEILERLERVKKEEEIHISALNSITKPAVSISTIGISAPACPLETSKQPRIDEMLQLIQEERTIAKAAAEPLELIDEEPIVLLIISEGGVLIFSYPFVKNLRFEDEILGSFLTAFNSFSDELFSEGLDRAKFGAYSVLMESLSDFTVCYLFKGQIYLAQQKLSHFTEQIQKDASILQTLKKFHETSQVVEPTDIPPLELLITEIFINSPLDSKAVKKVSSKEPKIVGKLFYKNPDFLNFLTKELKKIDHIFITSLEKSGAWGEIYLVYHELTEENRILKVYKVPFDESSKSVLRKQDKKLAQIPHENIVKLHQSGYWEFNEQNIRYSILEYFTNSKSLEELNPKIFQEKGFKIRIDLALTLIETIKNIREKGFTHGDLHEGNILITQTNELKVIDPGFSKISDILVDSDYDYIRVLLKKYFFSEKELEMDTLISLSGKKEIDEILKTLKQIKESFPKERVEGKQLFTVKKISDQGDIKKKYELVYRDLLEKYSKIEKREFRVAIAQIGVSKTRDIVNEFYKMKGSGLLGLKEDKVELIRNKVESMIENAHNNGANILLFPELIIDLNYAQFFKSISDLADKYSMYIIPGSYHDQKTMQNLSVVFGPDGILWEQEKHIPAIINMEGKRFKEVIDIGNLPRKTIICNTEFGRIAIAICRDFLDMDLRVELKNFEPPVDLIFNPAFTPVTTDFKAIHFDARRSIYAYCFFANVAEYGESFIVTPEKERVERMIPAKEENLIYKDIDLFKLRSERTRWEKEHKKERPFIQSTR